MPKDKWKEAIFGTATDPTGKTKFQGLVPKKKKKKQFTRVDQIMAMFNVSENKARIWSGGGYSDDQIREKIKRAQD